MKNQEQNMKNKKIYTGEVVSDKMEKTVVVETERTHVHPEFHKVMRSKKKYKVHDEKEIASVGDIVEFYEGSPVSKTKCMYLVRVVQKHA